MNERERIGKRIAEIRKEKDLTQDELADAAGIDRTNVAKLERGKYNVGYDILSNVADALECKVDLIDNRTNLKKFVMSNKDRDDVVGDLCTDLLRDSEFKWLRNEKEQRQHFIGVGYFHSHTQDAISEFFREYSGDVVEFEDDLYEENEK